MLIMKSRGVYGKGELRIRNGMVLNDGGFPKNQIHL
jgi:hypothetical protein